MTEQEWKDTLKQIEANPGEWIETQEQMYEHFLNCVPPLKFKPTGFINSEAYNHTDTGIQFFEFSKGNGKYFGRLTEIKYKS